MGSPDPLASVGIGLRQPHVAQVLAAPPRLGFVEVHSENFFADGGAAIEMLRRARAAYPVSLHGVGLGLGSAVGIDPWHLDRLERLVGRIEPVRVSDHACFARAPRATGQPVLHANDLLPIAFTNASLKIFCANVGLVQDRLRQRILVENLSSYLSFDDADLDEPAFFATLCHQSGCGLLLDLSNLMVNALNAGAADPLASCCAFVDALPQGIVGEIHLAGYHQSGAPDALVIDDHGSRVRDDVWALYSHALRRFGALPTLIEWDTDLPALDVLLDEADHAAMLAATPKAVQ